MSCKLQIQIPTTPDRSVECQKLFFCINRQIKSLKLGREVKVETFLDNKEMSIGAKRNLMYKESKGMYTWQIDSDDRIHPDAIELIYLAAKENKDCITFKELCIFNGMDLKKSNFSIKYSDWQENIDGFNYVRTPFFKTPIKTEICQSVTVPDIRFAEDHTWARQIKPLLISETYINEFIYWYQPFTSEYKQRYGIK